MECTHVFHHDCIKDWSTRKNIPIFSCCPHNCSKSKHQWIPERHELEAIVDSNEGAGGPPAITIFL